MAKARLPRRGEIWTVRFDPSVGAEIRKIRPAVVVSVDTIGRLPLRIVVPVTDWQSTFAQLPWFVYLPASSANGWNVQVTDETTGHSGLIVLNSKYGPMLPAFSTQAIGNALGWGLVNDTQRSRKKHRQQRMPHRSRKKHRQQRMSLRSEKKHRQQRRSHRSFPRQKRTLKKASITNPKCSLTNPKCSPVSATTTAMGTRWVMPKSMGTAQGLLFSNDPAHG